MTLMLLVLLTWQPQSEDRILSEVHTLRDDEADSWTLPVKKNARHGVFHAISVRIQIGDHKDTLLKRIPLMQDYFPVTDIMVIDPDGTERQHPRGITKARNDFGSSWSGFPEDRFIILEGLKAGSQVTYTLARFETATFQQRIPLRRTVPIDRLVIDTSDTDHTPYLCLYPNAPMLTPAEEDELVFEGLPKISRHSTGVCNLEPWIGVYLDRHTKNVNKGAMTIKRSTSLMTRNQSFQPLQVMRKARKLAKRDDSNDTKIEKIYHSLVHMTNETNRSSLNQTNNLSIRQGIANPWQKVGMLQTMLITHNIENKIAFVTESSLIKEDAWMFAPLVPYIQISYKGKTAHLFPYLASKDPAVLPDAVSGKAWVTLDGQISSKGVFEGSTSGIDEVIMIHISGDGSAEITHKVSAEGPLVHDWARVHTRSNLYETNQFCMNTLHQLGWNIRGLNVSWDAEHQYLIISYSIPELASETAVFSPIRLALMAGDWPLPLGDEPICVASNAKRFRRIRAHINITGHHQIQALAADHRFEHAIGETVLSSKGTPQQWTITTTQTRKGGYHHHHNVGDIQAWNRTLLAHKEPVITILRGTTATTVE